MITRLTSFFQQNDFIEIKTDPINNFQNTIRHAVHINTVLNPGNQKWKYMNLKSSSPNFRRLKNT
jgi:elongation factor P--beta-lysine ligase